jgi:hypothetical protein
MLAVQVVGQLEQQVLQHQYLHMQTGQEQQQQQPPQEAGNSDPALPEPMRQLMLAEFEKLRRQMIPQYGPGLQPMGFSQ